MKDTFDQFPTETKLDVMKKVLKDVSDDTKKNGIFSKKRALGLMKELIGIESEADAFIGEVKEVKKGTDSLHELVAFSDFFKEINALYAEIEMATLRHVPDALLDLLHLEFKTMRERKATHCMMDFLGRLNLLTAELHSFGRHDSVSQVRSLYTHVLAAMVS